MRDAVSAGGLLARHTGHSPPARHHSQKKLATLPSQHHTKGTVEFAWQPQGSFLATCGQNRIVNIFNRQGEAQAEIPLTSGNGCALAAR